MNRFLIVTNRKKDYDGSVSIRIKEYLMQKAENASVDIAEVDDTSFTVEESKIAWAECVIVLGGDGTLLRVAKQTLTTHTPVIGVNLGHLGYLAEVDLKSLDASLDALLGNQYQIENRMLLRGSVIRNNECICDNVALNDVVITRGGSLQALNISICVNKQLLKNYHSDGVIFATPTGSTAYNLSAGGPIVDPCADILLMTPICPHSFMNRSIVLKASDCMEAQIGEHDVIGEQSVEVNFDGANRTELLPGDCVRITKSDKTISIIKINKTGFLEILHRKMSEI